MFQLLVTVSALVAISILLLGINVFIFGRKFPETEVGKNRNMIKLGLRCPQCEERRHYQRIRPARVNTKTLHPDWTVLRG